MRHNALAFVGLLLAASVASAQTALRANDNLNVRTGPGVGYSAFGLMPSGSTYCALEKSGGFWKIQYDNRTGWVNGSYCSTISGQTGVKVIDGPLNVRSGPSTGYSILGSVNVGQVFWWITSSGGFYKINWNGRTGWISGSYVTRVALSGGSTSTTTTNPPTTTTTTTGSSNLNVAHYYQVNNYFCGPATSQIIIQYVSGRYYSQYTVNNVVGANSSVGSSAYQVSSGIRAYSGQTYTTISGFSVSRSQSNIRQNKPVHFNFKTRYLAYTGYRDFMHHSVLKGYTSTGFYIHDTAWGPNKWGSYTEVSNAVRYHHDLYSVRY